MGMAATAITFLTEIGLGWPGVGKLVELLVDQKPGKIGYAPGAGASPILTEAFGTKELGEERFSLRFDWTIGEVFATRGPSDQRILYPPMMEMATGNTMRELVEAINTKKGEPWIVMRSANFFFDLFPPDETGRVKLEAFHRIDPSEWWTDQGVSDEAVTRMRPGGAIWRDMTEDVAGRFQWVLLGVA